MRLLQRSFVATPWVLSSSSVDNAFLLSFLSFKPPHSHSTRDNRGTPATLSCVLWSRFSACSSAIQNLKQSVFEIMIGRDHKIQTKLEAKDLKLTALHCGHFFRLGRQSLQINWFEKGHLSSTENYLHTRVFVNGTSPCHLVADWTITCSASACSFFHLYLPCFFCLHHPGSSLEVN